jgi:hypothetical protein
MERTSPTYFTAYQSLKLTRDAEGVLVVEFHTNGGPLTFTAQDHTDFVAWNTIRWPISEKWKRPGQAFIFEARKT